MKSTEILGKTCAVLLCLAFLPAVSATAQVTFARHELATGLVNASHMELADIDSDGDLDVVVSARGGDEIVWLEQPDVDPGSNPWTSTVIGTTNMPREVRVADIDTDGNPDVVVTTDDAGLLLWYKAPADPLTTPWTEYAIEGTDMGDLEGLDVGNMDGDSDIDILLAWTYPADDIVWYECPDDPLTEAWTQHTIANDTDGVKGVCLADLDGDTVLDVVACVAHEDQVTWYQGSGDSWTEYVIATGYDNGRMVTVADIDGDTNPDVVCSSVGSPGLQWYAAPADPTSVPWTGHNIGGNDRRWGDVGDIDLDGNPDVVFSVYSTDTLYWYEAPDDPTNAWTENTVESGVTIDGPYFALVDDIDEDGVQDIVLTCYLAGTVIWYENEMSSVTEWDLF